jgi:hypothetical protein
MWNLEHVHEALARELRSYADRCDAEQGVRGLDALDELSLHPLLAKGLSIAGMVVVREGCFPGVPESRSLRRERDRCDLVVLPEGATRLRDRNDELRERDRWAGSLFEDSPAPDAGPGPAEPVDALWIEVKVVAQHAYVHGVPVQNGAYAGELTQSIATDARKLARQRAILSACVALVTFTEDERTCAHDVPVAMLRAMGLGARVRSPLSRGFAITDRIGNGWCGVWLIPVICDEPGEGDAWGA